MASSNLYTKRRSPPPLHPPTSSTQKPINGFFSKSILLGLFLLALPLFPSQAPDFIGETVLLSKFWELIHLLFVGIAVAYGLFSRKKSVDFETTHVVDESYVSQIFQLSSVFDQEFDNNSSEIVDLRSESVVKETQFESFSVGEIRNSQYFQERSKLVVVAAKPSYGLDGYVVHQPLGLPIRSLRSTLRDNVALEVEDDDNFDDEIGNGNVDSLVNEVMAAPISPVFWQFGPEMTRIRDNLQPLSVRSLRSTSRDNVSLIDDNFDDGKVDEVMDSPVLPVFWQSGPEMTRIEDNLQPLSVDETLKSRSSRSSVSSSSSSSLQASRLSHSRSVSDESLNSNVDESVKEKSSSRSSSPSLSSLPPPPSPKLVTDDDIHTRGSHSRGYSDGSLFEEESKVRGRRRSKKELSSKSLKLIGESSRTRNKIIRRSYPSDYIPSGSSDDSSIRRHNLQQKSDDGYLFEDDIGKGLRSSQEDSFELLSVEDTLSESVPALFEPANARRAMHSSRAGRINVERNSKEKESLDLEEVKLNSPKCEPQSWRGSLRGKSVRTIRSDRNNGDSSDDRVESKTENRGRTKPRRQRQEEELSIVLHQDQFSETHELKDDAVEEIEAEAEAEIETEQAQVALEEEEEGDWETQSNASHSVDRKADEFIAKFREQIRLQKLTSGEQPRGRGGRGGGGGGNGIMRSSHFR